MTRIFRILAGTAISVGLGGLAGCGGGAALSQIGDAELSQLRRTTLSDEQQKQTIIAVLEARKAHLKKIKQKVAAQ